MTMLVIDLKISGRLWVYVFGELFVEKKEEIRSFQHYSGQKGASLAIVKIFKIVEHKFALIQSDFWESGRLVFNL